MFNKLLHYEDKLDKLKDIEKNVKTHLLTVSGNMRVLNHQIEKNIMLLSKKIKDMNIISKTINRLYTEINKMGDK